PIARQTHQTPKDSFSSYPFRKAYKEVEKLGDKLARIEPLTDWEAFRPIIQPLYDNKTPKGGRPNIDEMVMVKMLVLQQWYGLSDPELERQATDRLSFRRFLSTDRQTSSSNRVAATAALPSPRRSAIR
ncbi:unnamed protein product, partial [marine sediment metagenome]